MTGDIAFSQTLWIIIIGKVYVIHESADSLNKIFAQLEIPITIFSNQGSESFNKTFQKLGQNYKTSRV